MNAAQHEAIEELSRAVSTWYVRKDSKFYDVENLTTKLSKDDVIRTCMHRLGEEMPHLKLDYQALRDVFRRVIDQKHADPSQSIPVWNGSSVCKPSLNGRYVWQRGAVSVNTWQKPAYRSVPAQPSMAVAKPLLDAAFVREDEREMFLNWLAWCLQNEGDKPTWAPFLYSSTKGSGKSTLCQMVRTLFGEENSVTQNNVDKLTSRFNLPILTSKLVVSEELNLRQDSPQGNALKTYITETTTTSERKGQDAERIEQCCCFLFTSNHLPLWIEAEDRRYYLIELDHDGHAAGPRAAEFAATVEEFRNGLLDDEAVNGLYLALMNRQLPDEFSGKTLNTQKVATPLMKRVFGASEQTRINLLRELLAKAEVHAVSDKIAADIVREELGGNINSTRHLMSEIGWTSTKVKWDGAQFARSVWTEHGFTVGQGKVLGPDGFEEPISEHFKRVPNQETID